MSQSQNTSNKDIKISLLARANALYRSGSYTEAYSLYRRIRNQFEGILRRQIDFNLNLLKKKAGIHQNSLISLEAHELYPSHGIKNNSESFELVKREIKEIERQFDETYYLDKYPDVEKFGWNAIEHYCIRGWRELNDPCRWFSTKDYLDLNEDVREANINPFFHYIVAGKSEGRIIKKPNQIKRKILEENPDLESLIKNWMRLDETKQLKKSSDLSKYLKDLFFGARSKAGLIVSISHDNYLTQSGGIQLCIKREEQVATAAGYLYLNVHPWQPLPILASNTNPVMNLVLNGALIGQCTTSELSKLFASAGMKSDIFFVIHSLLGHSVEKVIEWTHIKKEANTWFWLHDFFSLCPSFTLQRNNVTFCRSPAISSNSCQICIYGTERNNHQLRMKNFFSKTKPHIISPSAVAYEFWSEKYTLYTKEKIIAPHVKINWKKLESKNKAEKKSKIINIAYVGARTNHKGWYVFKELMELLSNDSSFEFYYFGKESEALPGLNNVKVVVSQQNYLAMVEAIRRQSIDFVVHWANWPETFSFTTAEAIAAGAHVLTNKISGNVAELIRTTGGGEIFNSQEELIAFFQSPFIQSSVEKIRNDRLSFVSDITISDMTLPSILRKGRG